MLADKLFASDRYSSDDFITVQTVLLFILNAVIRQADDTTAMIINFKPTNIIIVYTLCPALSGS